MEQLLRPRGAGPRVPTPPLTYVRFAERPLRRLPQLFVGLGLYGFSLALTVRAGLGVNPWSVLNEGVERHTPLSFGEATAAIGVVVLLSWIPLRQWPTFGTVANIVILDYSSDFGLSLLPQHLSLAARFGFLAAGVALNGVATAVYVGARLGPGPRDGLMTGASRLSGRSLRFVRTALELTVLLVGWLLGGSVGLGTVVYACTVGPIAQHLLPHFAYRTRPTVQQASTAVQLSNATS